MNPYQSAQVVLPIVFRRLGCVPAPESVVDVGCGNGGWLKAAQELGVGRILGMDFDDGIPTGHDSDLLIPVQCYRQNDLHHPMLPEDGSRFELVICLEVAEHLQPEDAEGLVTFLVDLLEPAALNRAILFSAAVPGQGPYGAPDDRMAHHNEQPLSYWQGLFERQGFRCDDAIREQIAGEMDVDPWYRANVFLAVQP